MPSEHWIEDAIGYSRGVCRELLRVNPPLVMIRRTVMVDTNYLIQVNHKDFTSMICDPNYENTVESPLKKQMARLFRSALNRKLAISLSNFIMREFIGRVPRRKDLLEVYRRYISVISPKNNYEPYFFDLAAAINSCIIESGEEGDITDTYSYILATLAGVPHFVTEDKDIKRLNTYFRYVREKDQEWTRREISKIKGVFKLLCDQTETSFPIDDILGFLFLNLEPLPVPVSIAKLDEYLPSVLDRTETILWMFQSLQEIAWMRKSVEELPEKWDREIVQRATSRINAIAQSVGLQDLSILDTCSLNVKLVEDAARWTEKPTDQKLASDLNIQLDLLRSAIYEEEEIEYSSREEQFNEEEFHKEFFVECEKCGQQFGITATYLGVVTIEPREMGAEFCHEWSAETSCPSCGQDVELVYDYWEYPEFFPNYENTECSGCKLIRERMVEPPTCTLLDFLKENKTSKKS